MHESGFGMMRLRDVTTTAVVGAGALLRVPQAAAADKPDDAAPRLCLTDRVEPGPFPRADPAPLLPDGVTDGSCVVRWQLDDEGTPAVTVDPGCPEALATSLRADLAAWRWSPPREGDARDGWVRAVVQATPCPRLALTRSPRVPLPDTIPDDLEADGRWLLTFSPDGEAPEVVPPDDWPDVLVGPIRDGLAEWTWDVVDAEEPFVRSLQLHRRNGMLYTGPVRGVAVPMTSEDGRTLTLRYSPMPTTPVPAAVPSPTTCTVMARVAEHGRVDRVVDEGCPSVTAASLRTFAAQSRFAPVEGGPARVRWTVDLVPESATGASPAPDPSALHIARRQAPRLPDEADLFRGQTLECTISATLTAAGRPTDVSVNGCPELFHDPVRRAMRRWRWAGDDLDGRSVSVDLTLNP